MGDTRSCPSPFCDNEFNYPGGPAECPVCGFPVEEWWTTRSHRTGSEMSEEALD